MVPVEAIYVILPETNSQYFYYYPNQTSRANTEIQTIQPHIPHVTSDEYSFCRSPSAMQSWCCTNPHNFTNPFPIFFRSSSTVAALKATFAWVNSISFVIYIYDFMVFRFQVSVNACTNICAGNLSCNGYPSARRTSASGPQAQHKTFPTFPISTPIHSYL